MEGSNGPGRGDNDVPPSPGGSSVEGEEDVFFHDNALPSPTNHTEGKQIYNLKYQFLKGTVSVKCACKDVDDLFTTVPFKALSDKV